MTQLSTYPDNTLEIEGLSWLTRGTDQGRATEAVVVPRILVVDDDPIFCRLMEKAASRQRREAARLPPPLFLIKGTETCGESTSFLGGVGNSGSRAAPSWTGCGYGNRADINACGSRSRPPLEVRQSA